MIIALLSMIASASASQNDIRFPGACDGSAAVLVAPSLFVSAYDERNFLLTFTFDGKPVGSLLDLDRFLNVPTGSESDLEGGALAGDGRIYWIGSHGRNKNAKLRPERHRFFATQWQGQLSTVGQARSDLLDALLSDPNYKDLELQSASTKAPEAKDGLNIEGLAAAPDGALFIGFRNPLVTVNGVKHALLVTLLNPAELVDKSGSTPRFAGPRYLDLGGRGIRTLDRLKDGTYRIVAGAIDDKKDFALFSWDGTRQPSQLKADFTDFNPEALIETAPGSVMAISDDGTDTCKAAPASEQSFRGRAFP
ncbi:MAG: DUF3616 domain-containing protein [Novosphingobium sp.]